MKNSILKAQTIIVALSLLAIQSCTKEEDPIEKPAVEKPVIETLDPKNITDKTATLTANVASKGSSDIQAIGFVYWDPEKFSIDLNPFFDTTTMLPGELILGTVGGGINLGTVGGGINIDTISGEIIIRTEEGSTLLGTVGGGINFPGDAFQQLLEKIKIINNQGSGVFEAEVKQLKFNTQFAVRAYAAFQEGIIYGKARLFETEDAGIQEGDGVTDIRGNTYKTLIINGLEWMAENLKTDYYANNSSIPTSTGTGSGAAWLNDTIGMRKHPNNISSNWEDYGYLYNWHATQNPNGLCPTGWRLPSKQEWDDLLIYLGGANVAGSAMKTVGNDWWRNENEDATNSSGFSVRGAGAFRGHTSSGAVGFRNTAYFWSSTQIGTTTNGIPIPEHYQLVKENGLVTSNQGSDTPHARTGMSVRCVKN